MADINRLPSDRELRGEACAWIARLNAHNVSAEDKARFEAWRAKNPRHAQAYGWASMVWQQMNDTGEVVRAVSVGHAFNATTERAIRRVREARARTRRVALAAAATLLVVVCVGWWFNTRMPETLFQTAIGERATIKLPDGSVLELNSNSRARIAYSRQARVVRLERGEAYFEVERDVQRPFWVAAGASWVGAVGTAFNVDMRATDVRVTVSEGVVKIAENSANHMPQGSNSGKTQVSLLKAGQQVNMGEVATDIRSLAPVQLTRSLAWRKGSIYFKDDRLGDVVDELSRYTALKIVIQDQRLRDLSFAGTFETNEDGVKALLINLQQGFGLNVRQYGRTAYISERQ